MPSFFARNLVLSAIIPVLAQTVYAAAPATVTFSEPAAPVASSTTASQRIEISNATRGQSIWPNWGRYDYRPTYAAQAASLASLNISCQNCTAGGHIDISTGNYNASSSSNGQTIYSWIKSGFLQYTFNDFRVEVNTELDFDSNFTAVDFRFELFAPPLQKLQLSRSLLDLDLYPSLYYGLTVNTTGLPKLYPRFSVSIPDGAVIYTNFSDPTSSFTHGFSGAQVSVDFDNTNDLPDFSLTQSLGFASIGLVNASGASGMYAPEDIDLGGLLYDFVELANVTSTFQTTSRSASACSDGPDPARQAAHAAHFEPYVFAEVIGARGDPDAVLAINDYHPLFGFLDDANKNVTLPQYNFTLPTTCLSGSRPASASTSNGNTNAGGNASTGSNGGKTGAGTNVTPSLLSIAVCLLALVSLVSVF